MFTKSLFVEELQELSTLVGHQYKARAYAHAAKVFSEMSEEEFNTRVSFIDIFGIGRSINDKASEFKATGKLKKLEEARAEVAGELDPKLYKVRKSYITKRIPLEKATKYVDMIQALAFEGIQLTVAGSVRREKSMIADIDMVCLATAEDYEKFLDKLAQLFDTISRGEYKASFMIDRANNIQLDIILTNEEEYPYQMLYLTGSKEYNIKMRHQAKVKGLKLNQTGLVRPDGSKVKGITTEQGVTAYLGIGYVEPKYR